jgi:hypothetical protein
MSRYNYPKFKILIDAESGKRQGLRTGDVVRRQYDRIYSLMVVLETGIEHVADRESAYFTGALLEGDEPRNGELLDFVRTANLFDPDRGGALYLTASDSEAPFMDVIDGLAVERSLCFPLMGNGINGNPDRRKYAAMGEQYLTCLYRPSEEEASRIFRITRNAVPHTDETLGLRQTLEEQVANPQRVIISYKTKASKVMEHVPVSFGYTSGEETDGSDTILIDTVWTYHLHAITVDYPPQYRRSFSIALTDGLNREGDWVEIADLNIVLQSGLSAFSHAAKVRIGKIKGIIDPVFGVLEGYGAYFQNLYATKNINIAGTLTAGDENGFSSTFYVGKIHKNIILNSLDCPFVGAGVVKTADRTPVGMGEAWQIGDDAALHVQSSQWRTSHLERTYCFSLWIKSGDSTTLAIYQDGHFLADIWVDAGEWKRYAVSFIIRESENPLLSIRLKSDTAGIRITAPQLEAGSMPSQYQPTDGTLSYVEDYGAWFAKGGIGGTIQNPLLRLNEDGSISSRDRSFVIQPDGTGHFASGRFKWTKDAITLQDVTIRWEDLDGEAQGNLLPKSVSLSGTDIFHYGDEPDAAPDPSEIIIYAVERHFTAVERRWQYLAADSVWKELKGNNRDFLQVLPSAHYWEERTVLSLRYIATCDGKEYTDIFTVFKQFDGQSAYSVYIHSTGGLVFRNQKGATLLKAFVYKGGVDVTDSMAEQHFKWIRRSDDPESDERWNSFTRTGKTLEISGDDVYRKAVFNCEVTMSDQRNR